MEGHEERVDVGTVAAVVAASDAFALEPELLIEADRRFVPREDVQLELPDSRLPCPVDRCLEQRAAYRRQGIGRSLLQTAVDWARETGVRKLELHVFPWNEPAIRLYEEFGFECEGVRRGHYSRDGADVDALLMAYHLPSGSESPPSPEL